MWRSRCRRKREKEASVHEARLVAKEREGWGKGEENHSKIALVFQLRHDTRLILQRKSRSCYKGANVRLIKRGEGETNVTTHSERREEESFGGRHHRHSRVVEDKGRTRLGCFRASVCVRWNPGVYEASWIKGGKSLPSSSSLVSWNTSSMPARPPVLPSQSGVEWNECS